MRVGAVIQARLGSTRLPGKTLLPFGVSTVLGTMVDRVRRATTVHETIVAIPDGPGDDELAAWLAHRRIPAFRGSESDVLGRYAGCAREYGLDHVLRLTGDSPLTDPEIIDRVVVAHLTGGCDYTSNGWQELRTYPLGLDVRILTGAALARLAVAATEPRDREHVTTFLHVPREGYTVQIVEAESAARHPELRLIIDTPEDYRAMGLLLERCGAPAETVSYRQVIAAALT